MARCKASCSERGCQIRMPISIGAFSSGPYGDLSRSNPTLHTRAPMSRSTSTEGRAPISSVDHSCESGRGRQAKASVTLRRRRLRRAVRCGDRYLSERRSCRNRSHVPRLTTNEKQGANDDNSTHRGCDRLDGAQRAVGASRTAIARRGFSAGRQCACRAGFHHLAQQVVCWLGWSIGHGDTGVPAFQRQNDSDHEVGRAECRQRLSSRPYRPGSSVPHTWANEFV